MRKAKPIIRNFRPGDEKALTSLWERAYASYSGYVPRSVEYWRWCILDRPGVNDQDILILQDYDDIVGYGVLGPKGQVLELAVDQNISNWKREKIAAYLITALEERSRIKGDEVIQFVVPHIDRSISRVLKSFNYKKNPGQIMHAAIIDLPNLIERILLCRKDRIPNNWAPTFVMEVNAGPAPSSNHSKFLVRIRSSIVIEKGSADVTGSINVFTDVFTITKLIFQQITLEKAIIEGQISISPDNGMKDLKTLIKLLTINSPWYTPLADVW